MDIFTVVRLVGASWCHNVVAHSAAFCSHFQGHHERVSLLNHDPHTILWVPEAPRLQRLPSCPVFIPGDFNGRHRFGQQADPSAFHDRLQGWAQL